MIRMKSKNQVYTKLIGLLLLPLLFLAGCGQSSPTAGDGGEKQLTVGVAFETLQTEYWVAGFEALKAELQKRNLKVVEAIADGDANRQLQQIRTFITRKVDGIVLVPKDAQTCIPAIKAANEAGIPIVLFNRPAADAPGVKSTAILLGDWDRIFVGASHLLTIVLLAAAGRMAGLGLMYYAGLVVAGAIAGYQQGLIRRREPQACFRAFLNNNYFGAAIFVGLLLDYGI